MFIVILAHFVNIPITGDTGDMSIDLGKVQMFRMFIDFTSVHVYFEHTL